MNEVKTMVKHFSGDHKCKSDSATCNWNQKWNDDKCQCECKKYCMYKKYYSYNASTCICENSGYLKSSKSTVDGSLIVCGEIIGIADSVLTNVMSTISANVSCVVSKNFDDKELKYKMDCYIFTHFY